MAPALVLKLRWKKEIEEGDGKVEAPLQTSGGTPVPSAAENQLVLANNSGVEIARAYVSEVIKTCMARNDTLMCKKFLRLVSDLRDRGVDINKANTSITELFEGTYNNLIVRYNEFVERIIQRERDPQAITLSEEDLIDKRQQTITIVEEDLQKRQQAITLPKEDLLKRQQAITLPKEDQDKRHQAITVREENSDKWQPTITLPEEFNAKVKELDQCKYDAFCMVLHLYNNHSVTIKEAHEMAKWPFKDRSDLMQDFKTLLPDTSIIPSTSLMLVDIETGQQQPPPSKKPRFLVGNTIEEKSTIPGESIRHRHGEPARLADKARKGKEKLDIEDSKDNMRKRKERNWEERSQIKGDNRGFKEHQPKKVSQRIADKRQLSSNDGSKVDGFPHLDRKPRDTTTLRRLLSDHGGEEIQLEEVLERIANKKLLLFNDGGRAFGSPLHKRVLSECIASRRLSSSDGCKGSQQSQKMSTRSKRPTEAWNDENIKGKNARPSSLPPLQL